MTFSNEPGEGTGVARSFYTAIAEALLKEEPLPNLDSVTATGKRGERVRLCVVLCSFRPSSVANSSLFISFASPRSQLLAHCYNISIM